MLTSADHDGEWTTVGVSDDIVTASWEALADGVAFGLLRCRRDGTRARHGGRRMMITEFSRP